MKKLAIIGAGSMAEALISGLIESKLLDPCDIWVTNRSNTKRLNELEKKYNISTSHHLEQVLSNAEAILIAMKPKDAMPALASIKPYILDNGLILSVLAGVSMDSIEHLLGKKTAIIRAMPNTSAAIGKSATALALNPYVSDEQAALAEHIFQTVGITKVVQENELDAVTGLSGSGPAYVYYMVEAMEKSALELGLDKDMVKDFIVQTFLGAAEMLAKSTKTARQLRKEVTSPGGTTEAGIKILDEHGVSQAVEECIKEATAQSMRLGENISAELKSHL